MPYPIGRNRRRPGLAALVAEVLPEPVNLLPELDFRTWKQSGVYGMTEVTKNSFTNRATSGIAKDIGAEVGKRYRIVIDQERGSGALRLYISMEGDITTAGNDIVEASGGTEEFIVTATGPWLTLRASVGDTTTTFNKLEVYEVTDNG